MTENVAPNSAANNADSTRGVPFYEKLKRDLRETIQKKRLLDKNLASLEEQIYQREAAYLEETGAGNIIKGFDNYIKGSIGTSTTSGAASGGTATRRKTTYMEQDRVFSRSSASFMRDSPPPDSNPVSHAPTPTSSQPGITSARESNHATPTSAASTRGVAQPKKNKKATEKDDEESETRQPKRLKITYARGGVVGD